MFYILKFLQRVKPTAFALLFLLLGIPEAPVAEPFDASFSENPEHAVLFVIDGLSYKVWEKLNLPVMKKMIAGGTLVEKSFLPPAAHPHTGAYAELQSCSIPNPILLAGTVFITRETGYLQQSFTSPKTTAFVSNSTAYITLNTGYTYSYQKDGPDAEAVQMALEIMKTGSPSFMHIHLQDAGGAGTRSMTGGNTAGKKDEWVGNIWAVNSPYRTVTERADSLLGVFINGLEKQGILGKTAILVIGDHGQNDGGWHPLEMLDSSITTAVLWGAGIKNGQRIPYAEHIDVVPTISALMVVKPPKTSRGRIIAEALGNFSGDVPERKTLIKDMDELFIKYRKTVNE
ncbi:MAG: sulfatase-like hydrolase/transferase, partial [Candidatus Latescibacterota bacterium]